MTDRASGNVPQSTRVKFKTLVSNESGPPRADEEVIDTQEEYDEWIAACTADRDAFPRFDFNGQMLLAVSAGQTPVNRHRTQITGIVEITGGFVGIQWQVFYRVRPPGGHVSQVVTCPQHVVRTRRFEGLITFHQAEEAGLATTLAIGEEEPPQRAPGQGQGQMTTRALGEEGPPSYTTLAVGEEGGPYTTLAVGEEDGGAATTMAMGEEGGSMTTLAVGEEGPQLTTLAVGEENPGPRPTTLAVGEEGPFGAF